MPTTEIFLDGPDLENGVNYPSSDGKPMAETYLHVLTIRYLLDALEDALAEREDVFIAGNMNWFWDEGHPKRRRAPDVMVVFGVEPGPRRSFRSWKEGGAVPAVCFEMASARTWKNNLGIVRKDYEENGVREYFIYDPTDEYLPDGPLMGFRRRGNRFIEIEPDEADAMVSQELRLCLVPEGLMLRLVDIDSAQRILTRIEQNATSRAEASAHRAQAQELAAEVARLKAQLRRSGKPANGAQ
jgi:Uma2 family endonuclease